MRIHRLRGVVGLLLLSASSLFAQEHDGATASPPPPESTPPATAQAPAVQERLDKQSALIRELQQQIQALKNQAAGAKEPPAAEGASDGSVATELRNIGRRLEQQTRQMEALSRQFSALKEQLLMGSAGKAGAAGTAGPAASGSSTPQPAATATASAVDDTPGTATATPAPTEEPGPPGSVKHTVVKGETLTSIAKRYNIPLAELQKANPIQDDRMLQIGQVLTIPGATAPAPAPQTRKPEPQIEKENVNGRLAE